MSTCQSCPSFSKCLHEGLAIPSSFASTQCRHFQDKSKFKELPCQIGDTCYFVTTECDERGEETPDIYKGRVCTISFTEDDGQWIFARYTCGLTFWHTFDDIGKTLFFHKAEAERERQTQERQTREYTHQE